MSRKSCNKIPIFITPNMGRIKNKQPEVINYFLFSQHNILNISLNSMVSWNVAIINIIFHLFHTLQSIALYWESMLISTEPTFEMIFSTVFFSWILYWILS